MSNSGSHPSVKTLLNYELFKVDPAKYKGIFTGFKVTLAEDGVRGLAKGWAPTAIGYSMQGLGKFGFYELFKNVYGDMLGEVCIRRKQNPSKFLF
jgi:hypothetical protein